MKKRVQKLTAIILCIFLAILHVSAVAFAADNPRQNHPVSLHITVSYGQEALSGVSCRLYRAADICDGGEVVVTDAFAPYAAVLCSEEPDAELAAALAAFVRQNEIRPTESGVTDQHGEISFPGAGETLYPGLYLLCFDSTVQRGHLYDSAPLLIRLPTLDLTAQSFLYNADVFTKSAQRAVPSTSVTSVTTTDHTVHSFPEKKLPQTGLLWWPVPILALCGLVCLLSSRHTRKWDLDNKSENSSEQNKTGGTP